MKPYALLLSASFAGLLGALAAPGAIAQKKAMIVLDGSGSMWGQIDGEAKITIARRVLSEVLGDVDASVELGLMAYGHRREGDCGDIELIVEPAAGMSAAIGQAAEKITPLGKTPLAASVRQAAEILRYTQEPATVILITDGIETCGVDICKAAQDLEAAGVDFQINVVGFGLSAQEGQQLICLAEETGGLYLAANDAAGLADALSQPLEEISTATPDEPEPEPVVLPQASIDAPDSVEIGQPFVTSWNGPGEQKDAIVLVNPLVPEESRQPLTYRRLSNGDIAAQTVITIAPVNPGTYELQYVWRDQRIVLASRAIEVIDAPVWLEAPATVEIGRPFTTIWAGPGARRDTIQIVDPRGAPGEGEILRGKRLVNDDFVNNRLTLEAPAQPGFYRLQYWSGDGREVLASREIEVLEAVTSLGAAAEVAIGATFDIAWVGPGSRTDYVEIYDLNGNAFAAKRLVNGDFANRTVDLVAPVAPGTYELRYMNRTNNAVLATRLIEVVAVPVSLEAPASVLMAQDITAVWAGPGARRDAIQIYDPAAGKVFFALRILNGDMAARTVTMRVPVVPGPYELRYYSGDGGEVLATRPFVVEAMNVSVVGPATVTAGERFAVTWAGPGARRDAVEFFALETGKVVSSVRLARGDPGAKTLEMTAPDAPGSYTLRYYNVDNKAVLAETPISVR
ncbi:MAG: VWA domain-containing protein [Alphaproteobacteria bacterium]|nr:VWA domain-containing protein [Alphaproteobacteria bacterium]